MRDMGLQAVINHLFRFTPTGFQPQIALGNLVKQALLWLPGNKPATRERVEYWLDHPLLGCMGLTNRAYRDPYGLQHAQEPALLWAGLDIDAEDNPGMALPELIERVHRACPSASLRTSFGGRGLHAFHVFCEPVYLPTCWANAYTRAFNREHVEALERVGVNVCKSDSRVFWVCGGQNTWVQQRMETVKPPSVPPDLESLMRVDRRAEERGIDVDGLNGAGEHAVSDCVRLWVQRFADAGIRVSPGHQNPVNIGRAAEVIRTHGGSVVSKSPMRSRTGINGYLDCTYTQIALWTYADGHTVWIDADTDSLIDSMLEGTK